MIELQDLRKSFLRNGVKVNAVDHVSLAFPQTGLISIQGESGCGKTTLLNCIALLDSFEGSIIFDGHRFTANHSLNDTFRSKYIGFVHQDYYLIEEKSVAENIQLSIDIANMSCKDEERIKLILSFVGMDKYYKRKINTLSGGQKQRVAIARALINNPKVLLADEPTAHLDSKNAQIVMNLLKSISKDRLVICVSHDIRISDQYCDLIIKFADGKIIEKKNNTYADSNFNLITKDSLFFSNYCHRSMIIGDTSIDFYSKGNFRNKITIVIEDNQLLVSSENEISMSEIGGDELKNKLIEKKVEKENISKDVVIPEADLSCKSPQKNSLGSIFSVFQGKIKAIVSLLFTSFMLALSMSFFCFKDNIQDYQFLEFNKNIVQIIKATGFTDNDFEKIKMTQCVTKILPSTTLINFQLSDNNIIQTQNTSDPYFFSFNASVLTTDYSGNIIYGRRPENSFEAILDEMLVNKFFSDGSKDRIAVLGYKNAMNFINSRLSFYNDQITIVGISSSLSPSIYVDEKMETMLALKNLSYLKKVIYTDLSSISKVSIPEGTVLISEEAYSSGGFTSSNNTITISDVSFEIYGTYFGNSEIIYMNETTAQNLLDSQLKHNESIYVMTSDVDNALVSLWENTYSATSTYSTAKETYEYNLRHAETLKKTISVMLIIVTTIIYFMIVIIGIHNRTRELCIQRILGKKKIKIFKGLLYENGMFCLCFGIPSFLLFTLIINAVAHSIGTIISIEIISMANIFIGISILLLICLMATIVSSFKILNKTGADLAKKYL